MFLHKSVICGHHNIYKSVWSLTLGKTVSVDREHGNTYDRHALSLLKAGSIIGITLFLTFFMTCLRRSYGSHRVSSCNNLMWVWSST